MTGTMPAGPAVLIRLDARDTRTPEMPGYAVFGTRDSEDGAVPASARAG